MDHHIHLSATPRPLSVPLVVRLNQLLAGVMMIVIISTTLLMWPITHLGFGSTFVSQEIFSIDPGSPAAQAGLRVGDRILMLYNHPIHEVIASVNVIDLIGPPDRPIPIVVQREEQVISAKLMQLPPPSRFQATKLAMCSLALICWLTGYHLGVVRQHDLPGSSAIACFWLCIGGLLGSLLWAELTALPIFLGQLWLIITVLAPLAVYIHLWFPTRRIQSRTSPKQIRFYFLSISIILNAVLFLLFMLSGKSFLAFADILFHISQLAIICSLAASGWLLTQAYHKTTVEHTRRQIRVIAVSCLSVMLLWVLLAVLPEMLFGRPAIPPHLLTLSFGLVPLAYLVSVRLDDLYRLDRLTLRFVEHLLATTCLGALLVLASYILRLEGKTAVIWFAAGLVAVEPQLLQIGRRFLPRFSWSQDHLSLDHSIQKLNTTLDGRLLVTAVVEGVQKQFGQPAVAFFRADIFGAGVLTRQCQERMEDLPVTIPPGALTKELCFAKSVNEAKDIQQRLRSASLCEDEQRLLSHPKIALWCPILHPEGYLLGLLLLGMRSDLDAYRPVDKQGLQRLVVAASLAFSHSVAYEQQVKSQAEIRQLYQDRQVARDAAAIDLSRKLHDQIINGGVQQNVAALKHIVRTLEDEELRIRLMMVLEREQESLYKLRCISEELHPMYIDDPLGLPMVLRNEVLRQQDTWETWEGQCCFEVSGDPVPLAQRAQWEAFRIVGEAITNAIKHADATLIRVRLQYPTESTASVQLMIRDNGRKARVITETDRGSRGVRYMEESARAVGGTLDFDVAPGQSTVVIFTFAADVLLTGVCKE